jgi:hypothetical protein
VTTSGTKAGRAGGAALDYSRFGLFFNYDLLGYAFMALATFCIAFICYGENKG